MIPGFMGDTRLNGNNNIMVILYIPAIPVQTMKGIRDEELTLYITQLQKEKNKQIEALTKRIEALENQ